jgi:hypothetical protein
VDVDMGDFLACGWAIVNAYRKIVCPEFSRKAALYLNYAFHQPLKAFI